METETTEIIPKLRVKTLSDRVIAVELASDVRTIFNVREKLAKSQALALDKIVLIREGRVLADEEPVVIKEEDEKFCLYLFYMEPTGLALDLIGTANEWDTKNRLKVFIGLYHLYRRDFDQAAPLLSDSLSTFAETGLLSFRQLVRYAVLAGMLSFDRPQIEKQVRSKNQMYFLVIEITRSIGSHWRNAIFGKICRVLYELSLWRTLWIAY